jgi:hypothetical protein
MLPEQLALLARPDLSASSRLVLLALSHMGGFDTPMRLHMGALQQATGLADRTMRRAIEDAAEAGALIVHERKGHGSAPTVTIPTQAAAKMTADMTAAAAKMTAQPAVTPAISVRKIAEPSQAAANMTAAAAKMTAAEGSKPPLLLEEEDTSKERKKGVRTKRVPTTLPEDFAPSPALHHHIRTHCPRVDLNRELSAFVLYWTEGKGAGRRYADWQGTFRGWCDRAEGWARDRQPSAGAAAPDGARAASPPSSHRSESGAMKRLRELAQGGPR